jgi:tellurite resistance protein TerC
VAWVGFFAAIATILSVDLGYFHRKAHTATIREASFLASLWISIGLAFSAVVWWIYDSQPGAIPGSEAAQLYITAFILEEALSVDNLFVFIVIFGYFKIAAQDQHRVLFYGILGAILMRGLFIFLGVAALHAFSFTIYLLAGLLLFTAARMTVGKHEEVDPSQSFLFRLLQRLIPVTQEHHDGHFFSKVNGRRHATTLFLCLILIEATDVLFAIDSVPAVLGVTDEAFIVYTSNIFAIVGLRSLYFVVAAGMRHLAYLKPALILLLGFIGVKMIVGADSTPGPFHIQLPISFSLGIVGAILGVAIAASIARNRRHRPPPDPPTAPAATLRQEKN